MSNPIVSFIVIILSLSFAFLYAKPEFDLVQGHRADLATLNDVLKDADSIKSLVAGTQETLDSVAASDRADFEVFLPETSDPIRFADSLQNLGFKNGLILEGIKVEESNDSVQKSAGSVASNAARGAVQGAVNIFTIGRKAELSQEAYDRATSGAVTDATAPDKKYAATKASFSFSTTLETFGLFLNDLEKSLRLMNIKALSITPKQDAANARRGILVYQYVVTIETYSLK